MRWVRDWHVGQLVMSWIAAGVLTCLLVVGSIVTYDSANVIDFNRARAVRDSVARLPPNKRIIADSVAALERAGIAESEIVAYIERSGLADTSFVGPTRSDLRWSAVLHFLVVAMLVLASLLPIFMFAATWVWFGGRHRIHAA